MIKSGHEARGKIVQLHTGGSRHQCKKTAKRLYFKRLQDNRLKARCNVLRLFGKHGFVNTLCK